MSDLLDEIFGTADAPLDEFYPGSKKKRKQPVEYVDDEAGDWRDEGTIKTIKGQTVTLYTVGALARALGTSVASIRKWTARGVLPQAPYRLPSTMKVKGELVAGRRLYTQEVIEASVDMFKKYDLLGSQRIVWSQYPNFPIEVAVAWKNALQSQSTTDLI